MGSRPFSFPGDDWRGFTGYVADPTNAREDKLAPPSLNVLVNENGEAESRYGYLTEFSIGVSGKPATSHYCETYDITFFALGTKVYYRDWANRATYDTGLSLTDGTTSRFWEFLGDVYLTNTTDGMRRIVVMRLNDAAATAGDGSVTVDLDGAVRLSSFGISSGNLRINGTSEAFNAVNAGTGVLTLTGTLSQSYGDNTVAIVTSDISSGREKASKGLPWKERLHLMGFPSATNVDQPNHSVVTGMFVIGQTGAAGIEDFVDFTFGTRGSTKITVGKGGKVTNILGAKDYIYFFKENEVYATEDGAIDTTGSNIGLTIPKLRDETHGCLNEDCAALIGNNELTYVSSDKRILRMRLATDSGAPLVYPDEGFDADMRVLLQDMDEDQSLALVYYHRSKKRSIFQLSIRGQWYWLVYDHNINAWQPPQLVAVVKSFFERKGVLFGTDASTDRVYSFNTAFDDDGVPIEWTIATAEFDVGDAMIRNVEMQGKITQPTEIDLHAHVTNTRGGRRSTSAKTVDGSEYTYADHQGFGADRFGEGFGGTGSVAPFARWKKDFHVYPAECNSIQVTAYGISLSGHGTVSRFLITGDRYSSSFPSSE